MRQITAGSVIAVSLVTLLVSAAEGAITLVSQARSATAITTADNSTVTDNATDFGPFVRVVQTSTTFSTPGGGVAVNSARSEINCVTDPNAIRAAGVLGGQGGTNDEGEVESGEAQINVLVTFTVSVPTPYQLIANARQSTNPRDGFQIELYDIINDDGLFEISDLDPAQNVNVSGILQPGTYMVRYHNELTVDGAEQLANFNFEFLVPSPGSLGLAGGLAMLAIRRRR